MNNTNKDNEKATNGNSNVNEDNAVTRFDKIQAVLSNDNYPDDDNAHLSDKLDKAKAQMDMVLNGLHYLYCNTMVGDCMTEDDHHAIVITWIELKRLIEHREEEHKKVWNLAFHGDIDPAPSCAFTEMKCKEAMDELESRLLKVKDDEPEIAEHYRKRLMNLHSDLLDKDQEKKD